jgi:2,3-bisphosphoglycerate-dependent phosphoglycerate mutase
MKHLFLCLLFLASVSSLAQSHITTVILTRHAEKATDGGKDPELSEAGKQRAEALATLLGKTKIDAIYSTKFKRTEMTAAPLAIALQLAVQSYDGAKMEEINTMLSKHAGGTILIVGHSNTTPAIVNHLTGNANEFKNFDDADYGNLVVISVTKKKKGAKVTWLRY